MSKENTTFEYRGMVGVMHFFNMKSPNMDDIHFVISDAVLVSEYSDSIDKFLNTERDFLFENYRNQKTEPNCPINFKTGEIFQIQK